MNDLEDSIRSFLLDALGNKIDRNEIDDQSDDCDIDLVATGILSSLEFITLISDIEEKFNIEIDFDEYDPANFNTFNGLVTIASNAKSK